MGRPAERPLLLYCFFSHLSRGLFDFFRVFLRLYDGIFTLVLEVAADGYDAAHYAKEHPHEHIG